jgi:hypothetical protein
MTQGSLQLEPESATERTARYLAGHLWIWLTSNDLMPVSGQNGWRTELSRCRQQYGMSIVNRVTRDGSGHVLTSEYRCTGVGWYPERRIRAASRGKAVA